MPLDRRDFLQMLAASATLGPTACGAAEKVQTTKKTYGIALTGLGSYSEKQLGPALLKHTKNCKLTGLITGTPSKVPKWRKKYGVSATSVYSYDQMVKLGDDDDIDIVYVVTPHGLHFEHTMAAIEAGKHVIVEKPMAGTEEECSKMIAAAKAAGVSLHVGYRLHHDPYHLALMEAAKSETIGKLTGIDGALAYWDPTPKATAWQIDKKLSVAGALYSTGVYPIQAAFYVAQESPTRVVEAKIRAGDPKYYKEVPGGYTWTLEFPSGLRAKGLASSIDRYNHIEATSATSSMRLDPAYSYSGLKGQIANKALKFGKTPQQALHMDAICESIEQKRPSLTPGEMGRRDVILLEAIVRAAETGKPVDLPQDLGFPAVNS